MVTGNKETNREHSFPHTPSEGDGERLLWEYIDGICSESDKVRIAALIDTNDTWSAAYNELLSFQAELTGNIELQEPHMRFTQNVMDSISGLKPLPAMRTYINRSLMRGIAAFFIVSISVTLLVVLLNINWNAPVKVMTAVQVPSVDLSGVFNSTFLYAAMAVAVILALVFLDNTLRASRLRHH